MVVEKVRFGENAFAVRWRHSRRCRLVGSNVLLPIGMCNCGARQSFYGKDVFGASNIVTNAGDVHYAEMAAEGTSATYTFVEITISTTVSPSPSKTSDAGDITAPPTGGTQPYDSTYPNTADADTDNPTATLADMVTYRASYSTSEGNGTITEVVINENGATFGSGTDPLMMHAAFASPFTKTSADTLKVYINHTFLGT